MVQLKNILLCHQLNSTIVMLNIFYFYFYFQILSYTCLVLACGQFQILLLFLLFEGLLSYHISTEHCVFVVRWNLYPSYIEYKDRRPYKWNVMQSKIVNSQNILIERVNNGAWYKPDVCSQPQCIYHSTAYYYHDAILVSSASHKVLTFSVCLFNNSEMALLQCIRTLVSSIFSSIQTVSQ